MRLTSKTIQFFLKNVMHSLREILQHEFHLKVHQKTFEVGRYRYPLHLAVFDDLKTLAYFDSQRYLIGLNKTLLYSCDTLRLNNILRHELLHYLAFIHYPKEEMQSTPHGHAFHATAKLYNILDSQVLAASMDLTSLQSKTLDLEAERMAEKVKKLLALAESSNVHEANVATLKANQIILQYNLDKILLRDKNFSTSTSESEEELEVFSHEVLSAKKIPPSWHAIYSILETFYVIPIFSKYRLGVSLEISGTKVNVEIAEYVAKALHHLLEESWKNEKKAKNLQSKTSFMNGVAEGYLEKIRLANSPEIQTRALQLMRIELQKVKNLLNPNLSKVHFSARECSRSRLEGQKSGKTLKLHQAIPSTLRKLLS